MKKLLSASLAAIALSTGAAQAGTIVYGNNATFGTEFITGIDVSTGQVIQQFATPVQGNGRGIAVVGTTVYYSNADNGNIYKTDTITHTNNGVFVNTGFGGSGVATIAFDGTLFYATGYGSSNTTNVYDANGNFVRTQNGLGAGRDGFEVANNNIVANRGDGQGPYDRYDLNGSLLQSNFLVDPNTNTVTGVTFDGTNYYVSEINNNAIATFNSSGTYVGRVTISTPELLLEDLSALGNVPGNPPPGTAVPEPMTLGLLGSALVGLGIFRRRQA